MSRVRCRGGGGAAYGSVSSSAKEEPAAQGGPQTRTVGSAKHLRNRSRLIDQRSRTPGFRVVRSAGAMAHSPTNSAWTTRGTRGRHPGPGRARDDRLGTGSCPGRGGEAAALRVWSAGARRTCLHRCGTAHAAAALTVPTGPRPANRRGSRSPAGEVPGRPGGRPPSGDVQGGRRRAVVAILGRPRGRPPVVPRSRARVMRTRLRPSVAPEGDRQAPALGRHRLRHHVVILGRPGGRPPFPAVMPCWARPVSLQSLVALEGDRHSSRSWRTYWSTSSYDPQLPRGTTANVALARAELVAASRFSVAPEGDRQSVGVGLTIAVAGLAILGHPKERDRQCTAASSTRSTSTTCDPRSPRKATANPALSQSAHPARCCDPRSPRSATAMTRPSSPTP